VFKLNKNDVFNGNYFLFIMTIMWIKCTEKIISYNKNRIFCGCNDWHRKIYYMSLYYIWFDIVCRVDYFITFHLFHISSLGEKFGTVKPLYFLKKNTAIHNLEDRKYLSYITLKALYIYTIIYGVWYICWDCSKRNLLSCPEKSEMGMVYIIYLYTQHTHIYIYNIFLQCSKYISSRILEKNKYYYNRNRI